MPLPRPRTDFEEEPYWTCGREGMLMLARCEDCQYWIHPPSPVCPHCLTWHVHSEPVSGRGRVVTFTVNQHQWLPDVPPPYTVAVVNLAEQGDLRVVARIEVEGGAQVSVGQEVEVAFEDQGEWVMPYFVPSHGGRP